MNEATLGAAFMLGLLGSSHCLVMCGGLGSALGMGLEANARITTLLLFQLGRVLSYTLLGAGLGALLSGVLSVTGIPDILPRLLSAALLVAMGLYISNWWRGLARLEQLGQYLWRLLQPLTHRLMSVKHPLGALGLGLCWAFLPCGLIYSALAWSATAPGFQPPALLMFCFGLGTIPVMFATGLAGRHLGAVLQHRGFRGLAALSLICFGLWTAWGSMGHGGAQHQHTDSMDHTGHHQHPTQTPNGSSQ